MSVEIRPVRTKQEETTLLTFPWALYRNDPLWMPPLLPQMRNRLNPAKNPVIGTGVMQAFIAWDNGKPVGTIACAIDEHRNQTWDEDNAIFGFFEFIEDYAVAKALLDTAVAWTKEQGKPTLWGPWMLDYEDSHGILIKGWDRAPVTMCKHNPPYYQDYVERYGMVKARRDSVAFAYDVPEDPSLYIPEKLTRVAERLKKRTGVVVRQADFSNWDAEIRTAVDVMNRGLAVLGDTRGFWDEDRLAAHAYSLKPILDPEFVLIAELKGQAIGWIMGLPDLNEPIKYANGLRYPWLAPKLWWGMRRRTTAISMKSIAVDPEYWNLGVGVLLVHDFGLNALAKGYAWCDLSLTGEDNPMTPRLANNLGAHEYKRYRIYKLDNLV